MRVHQRVIAVFFVVIGLILPTTQVKAAGSFTLVGTVYLIDTVAQTITLKDSVGTLTPLTVTANSKLIRNGKKIKLNGLVLGDSATVVADSLNNLMQLVANGTIVSTVQGGMASLNSGSGTVQIKSGKSMKNVQTSGSTRVMRNGQISSLKSLTVFDKITMHVTKGSAPTRAPAQALVQNALDIQAEGPEESEISGTISAVTAATPGDATAVPPVPPAPATVTITPKVGTPVTLTITADTLVNVGGATGTATDLIVGMFVEAEYDPITLVAFHIEAEDEEEEAEIEGAITAIDLSCTLVPPPVPAAPCTVTITHSKGSVTLFVNASTKIERNDASVLISDLQLGDLASAEYNAITLVAHEIEVETEDGDDGEGGGEKD